jgi:hypothetical protein
MGSAMGSPPLAASLTSHWHYLISFAVVQTGHLGAKAAPPGVFRLGEQGKHTRTHARMPPRAPPRSHLCIACPGRQPVDGGGGGGTGGGGRRPDAVI